MLNTPLVAIDLLVVDWRRIMGIVIEKKIKLELDKKLRRGDTKPTTWTLDSTLRHGLKVVAIWCSLRQVNGY